MQDVNVNGVKTYPMIFLHTTNKETSRQRNDNQQCEGLHTIKMVIRNMSFTDICNMNINVSI